MSAARAKTALVLTPRLPWPLDDGGRIGLWQLTWSIAQGYRTVLVSLDTGGATERPLPPALAELGVELVRVPHAPPATLPALVAGALGTWPYTLARYRNRGYDKALRRLVRERQPALVVVNHLHLATYADALGTTPWVLREHNVECSWMRRYAATITNPFARAYAQFQARRLERTEAALCERAALVLAIQDHEADELRRIAPRARIEVIPIGIDLARFRPPAPVDPKVVLVVGSFAWAPNAEGLGRFLSEGWPLLRARRPDARLRIVGKDLPAALAERVRAAGGEPVGFVDDVTPEFAQASLLLVPLWTGAGARIKIVEAMAAGVPVVSTPIGAEGLGLVSGTHALIAESPPGLADMAVTLLDDGARARELARAAHARYQTEFSLPAVARRTLELCAQAETRAAALVGD